MTARSDIGIMDRILDPADWDAHGVGGRVLVPKGQPYMAKSKGDEWGTPQPLFDALNAEFGFTLDACASEKNHKCPRYITAELDALITPWGAPGGKVFFNPPHSLLKEFLLRAYEQSAERVVVGLIPARTDTKAWHAAVMHAKEVRLIEGRLVFQGATDGAPFPSAVVVWTPVKTLLDGTTPPVFRSADKLGRPLPV